MIRYLTGVANNNIIHLITGDPNIGVMLQPTTSLHRHIAAVGGGHAYDNGAFGSWRTQRPFDITAWHRGLARVPPGALFCVVPDVVGDHDLTADLWEEHAPTVHDAGHPTAFVLQNGCTDITQIPPDADAVFIGGDDSYKTSTQTALLTWEARRKGLWVHMGRVNSARRLRRAAAMGCHSADGTFLRFGAPQQMTERLHAMIDTVMTRGAQLDLLETTPTPHDRAMTHNDPISDITPTPITHN